MNIINHEWSKTSDKFLRAAVLQNIRLEIFKTVNIIKGKNKQRKSEKLSQLKEN